MSSFAFPNRSFYSTFCFRLVTKNFSPFQNSPLVSSYSRSLLTNLIFHFNFTICLFLLYPANQFAQNCFHHRWYHQLSNRLLLSCIVDSLILFMFIYLMFRVFVLYYQERNQLMLVPYWGVELCLVGLLFLFLLLFTSDSCEGCPRCRPFSQGDFLLRSHHHMLL